MRADPVREPLAPSASCCRISRTKSAVLPVPVLAPASTSRPVSTVGIAWASVSGWTHLAPSQAPTSHPEPQRRALCRLGRRSPTRARCDQDPTAAAAKATTSRVWRSRRFILPSARLGDRSHGEAKPQRLQHGIHALELGIPFWRQRSIERRRIEFGVAREL